MAENQYEPELGQALFGQPYKEFEVPLYVEAALTVIDQELDRIMWNETQRRWSSPFGNTGNYFKNDTFHVIAYSWSDDEQPYNFKWCDVEISWYKYIGRGMSMNIELSPERCATMLDECMKSLTERDKEYQRKSIYYPDFQDMDELYPQQDIDPTGPPE